ncbi:MAG: hypothetical protein WA061_01760 [Microgenomates group bacterium]
METKYINLEPTWIEVLSMVRVGALNVESSGLENPCKIADAIRQAQKKGEKSITFTFTDDNTIEFDDGLSEGEQNGKN